MNHHITLNIISKSPHTSDVITGFLMLHEKGTIDLKINLLYEKTHHYPHPHMVEAIIDNKRIAFDTLDGYNWNINAVENYLSTVNFYFKRSFSDEKNNVLTEKSRTKIHPLGFCYHVTYQQNPIDCGIFSTGSAEQPIQNCLEEKTPYFTPDRFEAPANYKDNHLRIIFFTRLWEPNIHDQLLNEERECINQMRIQIIRKLRQFYPESFTGGVQNSSYAQKICKDIIIPDELSIRGNFIELVKQSDICIGSIGLHESIGWKTGEYIAASRSIVNEKLRYKVTGDFCINKNYLSYECVDECLDHVSLLMQNPDIVYTMKKENEKYYHNFLRPDQKILNALEKVFDSIKNPDNPSLFLTYEQQHKKNANSLQYIANELLSISHRGTDSCNSFIEKLEIAVFFFYYARITGNQSYEKQAGKITDEIFDSIQNVSFSRYHDELPEIGIMIEYLVQYGFMSGNTNEILEDFDRLIHLLFSSGQAGINVDHICRCGNYVVARLKNPANRNEDSYSKFLAEWIDRLINGLSIPYDTYRDMYNVIDFLAEVVNMGVRSEKVFNYLSYAVDKLETMVYEDIHFGIYPGTFNPLLAGALLLKTAEKTKVEHYSDRALHFINSYEPDHRQRLFDHQSTNWAFLYDYLWKKTNCDIYIELSSKWLAADIYCDLSTGELVESGMRLLAMNNQSFEDCLFWFPIHKK